MRVLCLSFWTPPLVRPRAIMVGKIIPEFIKKGVDPIIVTYTQKEKWDIDAPLYFIPQRKITKFNSTVPIIGSAFNFLSEYWYYFRMVRKIKEIGEKHQVDLICSFSNPQESNIIGALVKKYLKIPFISHFSDPWSDNPYKIFSALALKKVLSEENYVIHKSDRIIFTNDQARELVMKKYPLTLREKSRVISHCYDPDEYPAGVKIKNTVFTLSYIGAFYKQRGPEVLFRVVRNLIRQGYDLKLQLIGAINDYAGFSRIHLDQILREYGIEKNIEVLPVVSYKESLSFMKQADCLIVLDADMEKSPFLPSKVIEYAGSGTPVVGITPSHSPTAQFLEKIGYASFPYSDEKNVTTYLEKLIKKEIDLHLNQEYLQQFTKQSIASQFIQVFQQLV